MATIGPPAPPETAVIERLIRRTRILLRSSWVATGLGVTLGLLFGATVLTTGLDLIAPLWPVLRLLALLLILVPAAWALFAGVIRPLGRRLGPVQVARRIEAKIPGIHNRLVSCIDLSSGADGRVSPAFYRRLLDEALARIRNFRPSTVVDFLSLRRAGVLAFLSSAALVLAWGLFSDRLPTAMARIFSPFADIPPASGVSFTVSPGDASVLRGDDIAFEANIDKGDPDRMRLELRGRRGERPLWYELEKKGPALWAITLSGRLPEGFADSFRYRVHGGGTWSREHRVVMVDRPVLAGFHAVLHHPDYMDLPPREGPPQSLEISGPEGSTVEAVATAEGHVTAGEIQLLDWNRPDLRTTEIPERPWFTDQVPSGSDPRGVWHWEPQTAGRPAHTEPPAAGDHKHWFESAKDPFAVHPRETLYAWVYLPPDHAPRALMLEWLDETGWNHGAYWGDERPPLKWVKPGTAACRRAGALPPTGKWVRLETSAESVGLEGRSLRGMGFRLVDGQAYWGSAGVLPPTLEVVDRLPMQPLGDGQWTGRFRLRGRGLYRLEFRNDLGYANKTMQEFGYSATPDEPPQVVLERPGADLELRTAHKVPLVLAASDDYGLADVRLVLEAEGKPAEHRLLKEYARPVRHDEIVSSLDLSAWKLQPGQSVRYRAEARDRKGQVTRTRDFAVRVTTAAGADDQLEAFEKAQDPFRDRLARLIGEQSKVRATLEKMEGRYAPITEKLAALRETVKVKAPAAAPNAAPALPKLDPETQKELEALRKELAALGAQGKQNAQLGNQISADLLKAAQDATNLKLLPQETADEIRALDQAFQRLALNPLNDLTNQMTEGADPQRGAPDVGGMHQLGERVQRGLEAVRARADASAQARRQLRDDPERALARLRKEMLRLQSGLSAKELEALKDYVTALKEQLNRLEKEQAGLQGQTKDAPDKTLPDLEKKQAQLEKNLDPVLDQAKELLSNKARRMKRRLDFPDAPYAPDAEERVRPREEDPDEPEEGKKAGDSKAAKPTGTTAKNKDKPEDDDDETYMPALGGPRQKVDPRYAKRIRPVRRKPGDKDDPAARRGVLEARQAEKMAESEQARDGLASDEQTIAALLNQLQEAMRADPRRQAGEGPSPEGDDKGQDLAQMIRSRALQQALAMAARARQLRSRASARTNPQGNVPLGDNSNALPPPTGGVPLEAELGDLDPHARAVILKLSQQLGPEVLQSRREKRPKGYERFIDEYFKRLSTVPDK